jgi:glycosyltransferase involved in cell wall biosynthesis
VKPEAPVTEANAAIHYEDDAFRIDVPKLMGRQMAGNGFLHGFLRYGGVDTLYAHTPNERAGHNFRATANAYGARPVHLITPAKLEDLRQAGCLSLPGPSLEEHAWHRLRHGERAWSLCGITHTTASHRVMDAITQLTVAPVRAWDALVCTSRAVRDTVRTLIESQLDYLRWRLGTTVRPDLPQFPLIPLGVDCEKFSPDAARRARARAKLGLGANDVAALFVGRLSFHAKAHPQPMYLALERAARSARARGQRVCLIQTGWAANDMIDRAFRDGAQTLCPSVRTVFVDGRDQDDALDTWAAADVFVSLSDNIQETFGLTPIEAMAAGLPVVASDWDGYRDTVRDGIEGFLAPTLIPPSPLGMPLAERHETGVDNYDKYCGHAGQFASVDTDACAAAFERLFASPELRARMGDAGRARARAVYDWKVIVGRHQALWAELAERRRADADLTGGMPPPHRPSRDDPFRLFAGYATSALGPGHRVRLQPGATPARLEQRRTLAMNAFASAVLPTARLCNALLGTLSENATVTVSAILDRVKPQAHDDAMRALVWMAKMDLIAIQSPETPPTPPTASAKVPPGRAH